MRRVLRIAGPGIVALVIGMGPAIAAAQEPTLWGLQGLYAAESRVVGLLRLGGSGPDASGIVVGHRADSIYIVTALHAISTPIDGVRYRLGLAGVVFRADTLAEELDLALIVAHKPSDDVIPHEVLLRDPDATPSGAFVLGCPSQRCWRWRDAVQISRSAGATLEYRSPLNQPGQSGGAIVDEHGAVIGMVVAAAVPTGLAVRWQAVQSELERLAVPMNLTVVNSAQRGRTHLAVNYIGLPTVQDVDGESLFPSFSLDLSVALAEGLEVSLGWDRLVYEGWGTRVYAPTWRFSFRPLLQIGQPFSNGATYFQVGVGLFFQIAPTARVSYYRATGDQSFDPRTGVTVPVSEQATDQFRADGGGLEMIVRYPVFRTISVEARVPMGLFSVDLPPEVAELDAGLAPGFRSGTISASRPGMPWSLGIAWRITKR